MTDSTMKCDIVDAKTDFMNPQLLRVLSSSVFNPTPERLRTRAVEYQNNDNANVYAYIENGVYLGVVVFGICNHEATIFDIAVDTERQGEGIGSRLVDFIFKQFEVNRIFVETDDDAIGFYKKCGFTITDTKVRYDTLRYTCVCENDRISVQLRKAIFEDCPQIYAMQIESFRALLEKYQDYDFSPGAEKLERTIQRFQEPVTDYYLICRGEQQIGALRICDFGELCKLKQIFILPQFQERGYAQQAIHMVEVQYPNAKRWECDTILQEDKLCHLYEKMGYRKTGKTQRIKDGMDLVFYAKNMA